MAEPDPCDDVSTGERRGNEATSFARGHLVEVERNVERWEALYVCPLSGRLWLEDFPQGELQGGGPSRLRVVPQPPAWYKGRTPSAEETADTLVAAVTALADHFRAFGDRRAGAVADSLDGDRRELPQRVRRLFDHGMGGLLDQPLYRPGARPLGERPVVDRDATRKRDELAEVLFQLATVDEA